MEENSGEEESVGASSVDDTEEESVGDSSADDTEEESVGASSADDVEEENGGSSSENGTESAANKRLKLEEGEDRISDLPDHIIHHILSFLPSTEQSVQTGILSKRWLNQWTHVPVLIFHSPGIYTAEYEEDLGRFIDNTFLQYECSKMKKFQIGYDFERDINFPSKIRFAMKKHVEVLILSFYRYCDPDGQFMLPKFIFDSASLVELNLLNCVLELNGTINWPSLKVLKMKYCTFGDMLSIEDVLSDCPSLESLEINGVSMENVEVASESLKILILKDIGIKNTDEIEISCPNLEVLSILNLIMEDLFIEHILSESPLLHSLEIREGFVFELFLDSESLKKLVLREFPQDCSIEIACPNMEDLDLCCLNIENCTLTDLLPSTCVALDNMTPYPLEGCSKNLARKILTELQAVKTVKLGNWFVEILSAVEIGGLSSYPLLNIKCLTLDCPKFEHISGIVNVLHCSPTLERLVINQYEEPEDLELNNFKETYLDSDGITFTCLMLHLKTVKIVGLSEKDGQCKVLPFVEFLLKNARTLEKMVVKLNGGVDFQVEVSQKLLSFPRYSQHAILEFL